MDEQEQARMLLDWQTQTICWAHCAAGEIDGSMSAAVTEVKDINNRVRGNRGIKGYASVADIKLMVAATVRRAVEIIERPATPARSERD